MSILELHTRNITEKITLKQLPTLRQAFIVASVLILSGIVLSQYVHENFIFLTLLVSVGLFFSGTVGICPMVLAIQKMPWNKKINIS